MRDALALVLINLGLRLFTKKGAARFYDDIVSELRKADLLPKKTWLDVSLEELEAHRKEQGRR